MSNVVSINVRAPVRIARALNNVETFDLLCDLLMEHMHPEVGQVALSTVKAQRGIAACLHGGAIWNATIGGKLVGSLAVMSNDGWWYSEEKCLFDRWFYVLPEHRADGIGKLLEAELQAFAKERKMQAYIVTSNPNRQGRPTPRGPVAVISAFQPFGRFLRIDRG